METTLSCEYVAGLHRQTLEQPIVVQTLKQYLMHMAKA